MNKPRIFKEDGKWRVRPVMWDCTEHNWKAFVQAYNLCIRLNNINKV